jgi:hypothetical protein
VVPSPKCLQSPTLGAARLVESSRENGAVSVMLGHIVVSYMSLWKGALLQNSNGAPENRVLSTWSLFLWKLKLETLSFLVFTVTPPMCYTRIPLTLILLCDHLPISYLTPLFPFSIKLPFHPLTLPHSPAKPHPQPAQTHVWTTLKTGKPLSASKTHLVLMQPATKSKDEQ